MTRDSDILRVVIVSDISGTVLADYTTGEWQMTREEKAIGGFLRSLAGLAKDFDEGVIRFVSFRSESSSQTPPNPTGIEPPSLSLAITTPSNDVITGVFYKATVPGSRVSEVGSPWVGTIADRVQREFRTEHGTLLDANRRTLDECFQNSSDLPENLAVQFASFVEKVPRLIAE